MSYEAIEFEVRDHVAHLRLNRPDKLNAFNDQMINDTISALKTCRRDDDIRAVLMTGNGRGFSSGQDLVEAGTMMGNPDADIGEHLRHSYHKLVKLMFETEKPIIVALNGVAAGIGMSIALAADLRIAGDKATFTLGFSKIGLIPDGGVNWLLTRMIGYSRAYQLAITAEKVDMEKALAWGMVNQVVPHEQLMETAVAMANKLAAGPTLAFGLTKRIMLSGLNESLAENLEQEAYLQTVAGRSEDCREGVMAFLQKRDPEYKGK